MLELATPRRFHLMPPITPRLMVFFDFSLAYAYHATVAAEASFIDFGLPMPFHYRSLADYHTPSH